MSDIIYFLHHSGFIYENETSLLVFDFYKDPENRLETLLKDSTKKLYFFVSHYHADHFNRDIRRWEERAEAYIMHKNCWLTMDREEKKHLIVPGDTLTIGDLTVTMYGSTDGGGLVSGQKWRQDDLPRGRSELVALGRRTGGG